MTGGTECTGEHETLEDAAKKMLDLDVGALPGVVSQADIATNLSDEKTGTLVEAISAAP